MKRIGKKKREGIRRSLNQVELDEINEIADDAKIISDGKRKIELKKVN